jgi:hypothetical protein
MRDVPCAVPATCVHGYPQVGTILSIHHAVRGIPRHPTRVVYMSVFDAGSESGVRMLGFQLKTLRFEGFWDPQILQNLRKSIIPRGSPGGVSWGGILARTQSRQNTAGSYRPYPSRSYPTRPKSTLLGRDDNKHQKPFLVYRHLSGCQIRNQRITSSISVESEFSREGNDFA